MSRATGQGQDKIRIEMPRCADSRRWASGWIAVVAVVTVAAAVVGTLVQSCLFANVTPPPSVKLYHEGIGNLGTGIGLVLGFVAAMLGMARERKRSGRQSANTYPPVVSLRTQGWSFISD